jgi:hypothetical protein
LPLLPRRFTNGESLIGRAKGLLVQTWTPSEFKGIAEKAAKVASAYTPPGR